MLSKKKRQTGTQRDQWVLIGPAALADPPAAGKQQQPGGLGGGGGGGPLCVRLRHPSTGAGACFLFSGPAQQVWELRALQEQYHSWLVGQAVQQDGRLLYATPMDPLFLGLPYLSRAAQGGQAKFQPVEQLLVDQDFPACSLLSSCPRLLQSLHHLTEQKAMGSKRFYKYSQEKTLCWLEKKVEQTLGALKKNNVCVGGGVQSATFVRSKQGSEAKEEDYLRYAHGLISDYIPQELSEALSKHLNLPELASALNKTPVQKRKRPEGAPPVEAGEDYTKENMPVQKSKVSNGKMSAAQKSLAKVDKTGMKSISSFFSPKSKGAK